MNFSDIKAKSREQLEGNWLKSAGVMLVMFLVMMLIYGFINGLLSQILIIPISASVTALLFRVANNEGLDFKKFTLSKSEYIRYFVYKLIILAIQLVVAMAVIVVVTGGMMFTIVGDGPGGMVNDLYTSMSTTALGIAIVAYLGLTTLFLYIDIVYSMTPYIIFRNNEDIDGISAMKYSRELVKGYKWNIFLFELSFIGWGILALLSVGIGFLFLAPYYEVSLSNYYLELVKIKEEYAKEKGIIDRENESYYRTFVEEEKCYGVYNPERIGEEKKEDPMNVLTVEKLTTIEGYEKKDDKK